MQNILRLPIGALALAGAVTLTANFACAQGSLTPPAGPPAPVMKSLDQVEARTPLIPGAPGVAYADGLYTITQPGSYYLTGNLVRTNLGGSPFIHLTANNVTLDLNGFTLFGTNGTVMGSAIAGGGYGYRILNGHIVGGTTQVNGVFTPAGFHYGIELFSGNVNFGTASHVSGVTVRGVRYRAIDVSLNSVVQNCLVDTAGDMGISAGSVSDCHVINTDEDAISAGRVLNSYAKCVGAGDGITYYNTQLSTVQNSTGEAVSGVGIRAHTALNCYGKSASFIGVSATIANSCVGHCPGGRAVSATIGVGCHAAAGTNQIGFKYNMP